MVSFTGSTRAGRRVSEVAAGNVKRVSLELGGKSANVILDDADLKKAVSYGVANCYLNSGQTCSAHTRMLVPREKLAEAEEIAKAAAEKAQPGDPFEDGTRLGPLVSEAQRERVREYIEKGEKEGAKLVTGGAEPPEGLDKGYFVRPTVFSEVKPEMTIAQEEIFGPVLSIIPYDSEDEAAEIANGDDLRARRRRLVGRSRARQGVRAPDADRPGADQRRHLQPARPLRRLQAVRPRPGAGPLRPRGVPRGQVDPAVGARGAGPVASAVTLSSWPPPPRSVREVCRGSEGGSHVLARVGREAKDACLAISPSGSRHASAELLEANLADVEAGREKGLNDALIDRLTLTEERIAEMAAGCGRSPSSRIRSARWSRAGRWRTGSGSRKERVPIGVVGIVYEARPNVTIDAAALCLKSGNAAVLRGSSSAETSNAFLAGLVREALAAAELPEAAVSLLAGGGHEQLRELATQEGLVDLIIPRGGEGLKQALKEVAKVPVMYAAAGNCHVYVHEDADLAMAQRIAYNAKVQRPGVCNSAETLLVHRERGRRPLARRCSRS